jgi:hypothetical protein
MAAAIVLINVAGENLLHMSCLSVCITATFTKQNIWLVTEVGLPGWDLQLLCCTCTPNIEGASTCAKSSTQFNPLNIQQLLLACKI